MAPSIQVDKLEILNEDTTKFEISSLKGKKVIISFYASWCPNCLEELEILNSIKNENFEEIKNHLEKNIIMKDEVPLTGPVNKMVIY